MSTFVPLVLKCRFANSFMKEIFRPYGRNALRRRAVKVLNLPDDPVAPLHVDNLPGKLELTKERKDSSIEIPSVKKTEIIVPPYEKLKKIDARFTNTINLIKNRKMREKHGLMLLEGKRLINDAIDADVELKTIYFSREKDLAAINTRKAGKAEILKVLHRTLQMWSDLQTCPGVMGIFKRPSTDTIHLLSEPVIPVNVICDNIRDPGNLGSIIRNAAAAGCENVLLMKGCVDPWENKVLKTGCGGHFRIPIINDIEWIHLSNYISKKSKIFIADNTADIDICSYSPEFINYDEGQEDEELEGPKKYITMNEHEQIIEVDETYQEPTELEKFEVIELPCYLYSSVKYPKENIVLYIGGETHGIDTRIVKLASEYEGKKIKIPLENNMNSLNSSFALTVILYEIKRQLGETFVTK